MHFYIKDVTSPDVGPLSNLFFCLILYQISEHTKMHSDKKEARLERHGNS